MNLCMDCLIGIDIGGTNLRIGVVSNEKVIYKGVYNSAELFSKGNAVDVLFLLIQHYIALSGQSVHAVSIGIPGAICNDNRTIFCTPNLLDSKGRHLFERFDLVTPLQEKLGIPVYINKDVNNLLLYDISSRPLFWKEILLGIYIGTGYGTAVSLYGDIFTGAHGLAMDMGHMPFFHASHKCYCGKAGCAEGYASGLQLIRLRDQFFPDTPLDRIFCEHCESAVIEEFIYACALPLATLAGAFDPHAFIIGGGVIEMEGFPKKKFERIILEQAPKAISLNNTSFYYSPKKVEKGVIGAVLYAKKMLSGGKRGKDNE